MNTLISDLSAAIKFSSLALIFPTLAITLLSGGESFYIMATLFLLILFIAELPIRNFDDWNFEHPQLFKTQLVVSVFALFIYLISFVWYWLAPECDFLSLAAASESWLGIDIMSERESATASKTIFAGIMAVLCSIALSAIYGHELIHNPINSPLYRIGVFAHIITFFSYFSVSHPIGHHHLMATGEDHATPRRGENLYSFAWRSRIGKQKQTWTLEKNRLNKLELSAWHWKNRALRNWCLEAALAMGLISYAGWHGVSAIILVALSSNLFMEIANYVQHYGLLRAPQAKIQAKHIWTANHTLMNFMFAGAGRHASHHASTGDFWHSSGGSDKDPRMAAGILLTALISLVPFLFKQIMNQKLIHWDWEFASEEEQRLAIFASKTSGDSILIAHADELETSLLVRAIQST